MDPAETAKAYDRIAGWWAANDANIRTGIAPLERAIALCQAKEQALDAGCGTGGRLMDRLLAAGFSVTGLDVSEGMLAVARQRRPRVRFEHADVAAWRPARTYDLVLAWDSTFHLPMHLQEPVLRNLCRAVTPGGVLLSTAGGAEGEVSGPMAGQMFHYTSLAEDRILDTLRSEGMEVVSAEHDQLPEMHLVVLARRPAIKR